MRRAAGTRSKATRLEHDDLSCSPATAHQEVPVERESFCRRQAVLAAPHATIRRALAKLGIGRLDGQGLHASKLQRYLTSCQVRNLRSSQISTECDQCGGRVDLIRRHLHKMPTHSVFPSLARIVACVLQAPPGAGKTTRVPLALLDEPWLANRKIIMLEPRRLAARAAARRMASTLGESVGETIGFRVRGETRVSRRTGLKL